MICPSSLDILSGRNAMIERTMKKHLKEAAKYYPVVAVLGPRQSGKTTLVRETFPDHKYINLEDIVGIREYIQRDPKGFLDEYRNEHGIILDEFQHVPLILSYLQLAADEEKRLGYFILTGSHNFLMNEAISQTLAGRIGLLTLLPLSIAEIKQAHLASENPENTLYKGFYPLLYTGDLDPTNYYNNYLRTYVERDVRQLKNVGNLRKFQEFMQLCAGRIGQTLVVASLAKDCGITVATATSWLSILEATYVIFLLRPYHTNAGKRLVKSPKLYFYDTGLAALLLSIKSPEQLFSHYLRGGIFESMILSDIMKNYLNRDKIPRVYFWRDKTGNEVDCLLQKGQYFIPVEIKSSRTIALDFFENLTYFIENSGIKSSNPYIIYGGKETQNKSMGKAVSWLSVDTIFDDLNSIA